MTTITETDRCQQSTFTNIQNACSNDGDLTGTDITNDNTQLQQVIDKTTSDVSPDGGLQSRILQIEAQERLLREKEALISSRNRMLQYALERQTYKRKWIYILISLLFAVLLLILVIYTGVEKAKKLFSGQTFNR